MDVVNCCTEVSIMGESPRGGGLRQKEVRSESEGSYVTRGLGDSATHELAVARYPVVDIPVVCSCGLGCVFQLVGFVSYVVPRCEGWFAVCGSLLLWPIRAVYHSCGTFELLSRRLSHVPCQHSGRS